MKVLKKFYSDAREEIVKAIRAEMAKANPELVNMVYDIYDDGFGASTHRTYAFLTTEGKVKSYNKKTDVEKEESVKDFCNNTLEELYNLNDLASKLHLNRTTYQKYCPKSVQSALRK